MKTFCVFEFVFKRFQFNKIGVGSELGLSFEKIKELKLQLEWNFQMNAGVVRSWRVTYMEKQIELEWHMIGVVHL